MESETKWRGKSYGGYFGHKCFYFLFKFFGLRATYGLLIFVATYFIFFKRGVYKESASYLRLVVAPKKFTMLFCVYKHIFTFGKTLIDKWVYLYGTGKIKVDNTESEKIAKKIPVESSLIVVNAHVGGWELSASQLEKVFKKKAYILGINSEDENILRALEKDKKENAPELIAQNKDKISTLNAYALLKKSSIVAMLGDRNFGGRTGEVIFFGNKIQIPQSPFILAQKANVPIIQIHCMRVKSREYKMYVFDFSDLSEQGAGIEKYQQRYADNLEFIVKKYPYQWCNFYDFFESETGKKLD